MKKKRKKAKRLSSVEANFRALFSVYKRRAKKRKVSFTLSPARFRRLTKSPCFLCGAKPKARYKHSLKKSCYQHAYVYNGIDRINSRRGYTDDNSVPCCWRCNAAKSTLSLEKFLLHVYEIYQHRIAPALQTNED